MSEIKIKELLNEIEKRKQMIAFYRDQLRKISDLLADEIDSLDRGIDGLEDGKIEIENAIDALSEHL